MPDFLSSVFGNRTAPSHIPVVAEVAWAHDGKVELGKAIVDGAAGAGADAINFHVTDLADYMVPSYANAPGRLSAGKEIGEIYKYLERLNLSFDQIGELAAHARSLGLVVGLMPNDKSSLEFASGIANLLTIHPSCIFDEAFVRAAAAARLPLMLYAGGLTLGEIDRVISWAAREGNESLILQYGFQTYPTPIEANRIRYIATLKSAFGRPVSFADHTDGDDPMAFIVPLLAVAAGADLIEKHMTHDRALKGEDYEAALDPKGMQLFVSQLRQASSALGSPFAQATLSVPELRYRGVVRKRAVLARAAVRGTSLSRELVSFRRSDAGFYPEDIEPLYGNVALSADAEENTPVDWPILARTP